MSIDIAKLDELLKYAQTEFDRSTSSRISTLDTPQSIFEVFFKKCQQYHQSSVQSLQELRTVRSTKAKGDLFELFCQRYLMTIKGYEKVWLLKELSDDLKKQLKLPMGDKDYGIDLVCLKDNQYSAVQCKFKTPRPPIKVVNKKNEMKTIYPSVNWKELSTFNELCNASGPWKERITMTTAPSVRRLGGIKDPKDRSICLQTFKSLTVDQWLLLMNIHSVEIPKRLDDETPSISPSQQQPQKISIKLKKNFLEKSCDKKEGLWGASSPNKKEAPIFPSPLSLEEIRAQRLAYFCPQKPTETPSNQSTKVV